jgi:membrane-associated phospholipid phosphatase
VTAEAFAEALADALGTHALTWFLAVLAVLLTAIALGWRLADRLLPREDPDSPSSLVRVALRIAVGFLVIVGGAFGFAEVAEEIGEDEPIVRFDERLTLAIADTIEPATLEGFAFVTRFGDTLTLTVLCIVVACWLVLRGGRGLALAWVLAVTGNALLNQTLKQVFERVRPLHEHGLVQAQGWSFPSGHSSGSVVAYGMLAYVLVRTVPQRWHLPIVLVATALAFCVGSSRVFLQVHFASDVLAGFLSGLAWLSVCIASVELARRYRGR